VNLEQNVCYNQRRCATLITEYEHQDVSTPTKCFSLEHVSYVRETELTFIQQWKFGDICITRKKSDIGDAENDEGIEKNWIVQISIKYIIIIFIYCNWAVTRWQWLFYMYTKHEIGYY